MTHREQLAILALLIVLAILAWFFWPAPTQGDAPVATSAVPAGEFSTITPGATQRPPVQAGRTLYDRDAGRQQDKSARPATTPFPAASAPATATPSASKRVPTPTPVSRQPTAPSKAGFYGVASWFASPRGVSAAGPALRTALGPGWRGSRVTVCAGRCITVVLGDWCACSGRVIDLDDDQFARLAPLSRGIVEVSVRW